VRPDELLDEFEIDWAPIWPADDDRLEPIFLAGPLSSEFEELEEPDPTLALGAPEAPLPAGFEEFLQLDPERSDEEPDEPPPAPRQRAWVISLFGSLGVHLLPLIVLISWSSAPAEIPATIPVQFVIEESPSAPDKAPPDQLVTETISETPREPPAKPDSRAVDTTASPPVQPPQTSVAIVMPPPPKPNPPPEPPPRQPAATALPTALLPTATPPTATLPTSATPIPAPREAQVPGPDPARSDYFAHLVALTRGHLDMLPAAFLAGRRGQTVLSVVVLGDGTIGRISVKRSSGYPDIDTRIEQIVAAVGRFPPPPESFQRPSVELDFNLTFPNALLQ
jgi:TonB family protein